MGNIQEKISSFMPEAVFEEGQYLTVSVPSGKLHELARFLRDNEDLKFDNLASLIGNDWGETLGVVYYLNSTVYNHWVILKTETSDRENPLLYSVCDLWKSATLNEREVYDFYGIRFINHPDMRHLFLREDWVGFPFRKDYDANPELNPIPVDNEECNDKTIMLVETPDGKIEEKERILFEEDEYVINIGPQHPATHGVLRFKTSLDGENIKKIDVHSGYIHRGIEKLWESMTYPQTLHMTDRLDYLSAHNNRHALCLCIEKAMQLEVPERAQYIRTMMDELMRISSHLLFFATMCMDLGALTAFFYGFRDREKVLDIFEETCGARMTMNYDVIGGVIADLHPDFQRKVKDLIAYLPDKLKEYHQVFSGNVIAQQRLKGVGVLSREDAINYGVTGPSGRASGWACDVRKCTPYGVYDKVDFEEVLFTEGDSYARYLLRLKEVEQSLRILEQLVDNIPEGDYCAKTKPVIRVPEGRYFQQVEAARGAFGVYLESRGDKTPYRLKVTSPGLTLVGAIDHMTRGSKIADLIAIGGSLDYVVPDIDR
ncbi:NADH-quinone oxidoreductase subunit D [Coprobacter tertius]|uniref:NADH-quinone oxidoreductase subunit D n=1 Tax=Coprobacter tertius TaxID=2944915 RepID=A0ABT1MJX9_9BACT|nr:NADH-quinone oxidoreductase subunit D [Coprobacter tertius]MCP9611541.1 NADH-quinone oxidoreductase subunit D [Coprobacter tertius]